MAKDDYHVIVYQILSYLYVKLKAGEPIDMVERPAKNGVSFNKYTITHEYGHILHNQLFSEAKANGYLNSRDYFLDECKNEIISIAMKNNPNFDYLASISEYGRDHGSAEFFAECFVNSQLGASNDLGNAMLEWLLMKGL